MQTYVVANRKGGCGKSCTSSSMFSWLEQAGKQKRVLLIDLDSQCNSSYACGIDVIANPDIPTIADVISGDASLKDVMQKHSETGYVVPGAETLVEFDNGIRDFKFNLKNELKSISKDFDYVVIDAPPSLGKLTVSALLAGDKLIIPCQADIFSIQALNSMVTILKTVSQHNKIHVSGILLTRNNERLLLTKVLTEMLDEKARELNTKIFKSRIREGVAIREAIAQQVGLFQYDPKLKTNVAQDYNNFFRELMEVK